MSGCGKFLNIDPGEILYTRKGLPELIIFNSIFYTDQHSIVVSYRRYLYNPNLYFTVSGSVEQKHMGKSEFEKIYGKLKESDQTGKWPIGEMISYKGEAYTVLGYFRRFIAAKQLEGTNGNDLAIIRRYHKSIHRHIMV